MRKKLSPLSSPSPREGKLKPKKRVCENFGLSTFPSRLNFEKRDPKKTIYFRLCNLEMNTRGIRVDAHADEHPRSAKILFPWRDAVKGPIAKKLLVKHVLLKGLHLLKGTPKVGKKWNNLVAVFKKEPQIVLNFG